MIIFTIFLASAVALSAAVPIPVELLPPKYTLPPLPYAYGALEPYISNATMMVHHGRHFARWTHTPERVAPKLTFSNIGSSYVSNLNAAVEALAIAKEAGDIPTIVEAQLSVNYNSGGALNHMLWFRNLAPANSTMAVPMVNYPLIQAIHAKWGTLERFIEDFMEVVSKLQGSGWGWLYKDEYGELRIRYTENQYPIEAPEVPVIAVDAWEHAYYLDYRHNRTAYLQAIWKVVNWEVAGQRFDALSAVAGRGSGDLEVLGT